jgi:hypothetical protein
MSDTPEREHTYDDEQEQQAYEQRELDRQEAQEDAAPAGDEVEDAEDEEVGGG